MGMTDKLKGIIGRQKAILTELEAEYQNLEQSDLTRENDALKTRLESISMEFIATKERLKTLADENAKLKNALYEQIYSERLAILNLSAKKLDVYFKSNYEGELNRLSRIENSIKQRIAAMTDMLKRNNIDIKDEIYGKLEDLSALLDEKITLAKAESNKSGGVFSENEKAEFESLKNEQITDGMIKESAKKNNFEAFIGLNLINKLGILLIVIGAIVASQYTYFKLPDMLRGIMIFGLGAVMLVAGEVLNRRKANVFSLGITAGGVAVLYVALATSYFGLKILGMYPAIMLCVLITGAAFVLSVRYNAQVILAFALVGGYLPMFSIGSGKALLCGAMIYFVILNVLALLISFNKKWTVGTFVGLLLNIAGTVYICGSLDGARLLPPVITILYVAFAFVIYTLIPIISTHKSRTAFKKPDVALMGINTFFSSVLMYWVFDIYKLYDYNGLLAILFASVYLLLGKFIEAKRSSDKNTRALFYLTGFAFVVLIIPLQFGKSWLSLGWLAEGVALAAYGILRNEKGLKKGGFIIGALCLASFLLFDVFARHDALFAYKYLAITFGSLIILGAYAYKGNLSSIFEKCYKYLTVINLWIYTIYVITGELQNLLNFERFNDYYLCNALAIAATFLIAYAVPRIKILCDNGVKTISIVMYAIGILWLFILNTFGSPLNYGMAAAPMRYTVTATAVLLVMSLFSVFALYDLIKCAVMERKLGVEWFPLIVSGYFVLILTQNLITQYHLAFSNAAISIIYVVAALTWIVLGFAKRYAFLRRFGLGLSVMAVVKLFLLDLSTLTRGYQIVSYFVLGITLLVISFVYQYFNKRLELRAEEVSNVSENN